MVIKISACILRVGVLSHVTQWDHTSQVSATKKSLYNTSVDQYIKHISVYWLEPCSYKRRQYKENESREIVVQFTPGICAWFMLCSWWRHQMETFSSLLAICAGNSPFPGEFPTQRPVTQNFGVFFDLRPNKRLSKQSRGWWFETQSCTLWRHCNVTFKWCHQALYYYSDLTKSHLIHPVAAGLSINAMPPSAMSQ